MATDVTQDHAVGLYYVGLVYLITLSIASTTNASHVLLQQEPQRSQKQASVIGETNEQRLANLG
jgi:hypothetical protein